MKHCMILLIIEMCCISFVFSQGALREFVIDKDDNPQVIQKEKCNTPDVGVLVFYTTIPNLKFSMPDTPSRLKNVSDFDKENNCYVLCVQPNDTRIGGILQYSISITANDFKPMPAYMVSGVNAGIVQYFNIIPKENWQEAFEILRQEIATLRGESGRATSTNKLDVNSDNNSKEQNTGEKIISDVKRRNGDVFNPDGIELVYVEGKGGVTDFYIGKFEVTQAQWTAIMGRNPSGYKEDFLPVTSVSWNDIQVFISNLNRKTGSKYRLPTEAEWEYAARGGNISENYKFSGSNNSTEVAWTYYDRNGSRPSIVGTKAPNELGIYDMSGNVWEWCANQFRKKRVFRGGATNRSEQYCLPSTRTISTNAKYRHSLVGFRMALTPQQSPTNTEAIYAQNNKDVVSVNASAISKAQENVVSERITGSSGNGRNGEIYNPDGIEMIYVEGKSNINDFYIGKFEVTQAQWKAILGKNPSRFKGDLIPVQNVSWNDIQIFISILNNKTGKEYRLLTEAEWEYAARGGNNSRGYLYSGSNNPNDVAWFSNKRFGYPQPVGQKSSNELGIYDMSGNVWEWCEDQIGQRRVFRGGASNSPDNDCLPMSRYDKNNSNFRKDVLGFRLGLTPQQKTTTTNVVNGAAISSNQPGPVPNGLSGNSANRIKGEAYNPDGIEMIFVEGKGNIIDLYIGKYEVTQAQWIAIMGKNPSRFKSDIKPVQNVSWDDIQKFVSILNKKTGRNYRLPTEVEWEHAARGGNLSRNYKYSGSNTLNDVAWYNRRKGGSNPPNPVGAKSPNELGIYDMSGNVWEICADLIGKKRVMRGGASNQGEQNCLPTSRNDRLTPSYRSDVVGFRLVLIP